MDTEEYSFWDLISEYKIEIPAIQRDYAQGREGEKRIANALIDDLFKALVSTEIKKINLYFIYGKTTDERHLIPLDGQQRLTTLFLLHWFLSIDFLSDSDRIILSKFTYETRPSSEDFCLKLVKDSITYIGKQKLSKQIENSKWFFLSWKNDPTISAMLNMLDIIQNKFEEPDRDLFEKLISGDSPIRFHFLPLEKFKLDDKIYVKMNSRGKPLTDFENFKSNFSVLFDIENKSKLDNEWLDIFWNFEKDRDKINIDNVDKKYLNFLKNTTLNFYVEKNIIDKQFKDNFDIFDKYKEIYSDLEYLNELSKILDSLISFNDSERYFANFLKDEPDYRERLQFYAVMLFFVKKGNINSNLEVYEKWIRVCINLINNTRIEEPDVFSKGIQLLKALSNHIDNLYEYLSKSNNKVEGFLQKQWDEEKIKASLIFNYENIWETEIYKIEKHHYFDGQIGFILEFAKKNEKYDIKLFADYSAKLAILFGNDFKDNRNYLFQRGLLTFGDYLVTINDSLTFCTFSESLRAKIDNWRKVFDDREKSLFLKNLLDKIHIDNMERDLNNVIHEYSNLDWKYWFIKDEEIIKSCKTYKYRIRIRNRMELCRSEAIGSWRKHAELYSFALFKSKLEGKKFLPFQFCWYKNSSDYDPDAVAVIDSWILNKYNFSLDIKYNDHFILRFYEKNRNSIPNEVKVLLTELNFQQKSTILYESWEYDIKKENNFDFDKVKEIIDEQTKKMQNFVNNIN